MMRIRRVASEEALLAFLESSDAGALPLCFTDAQRPWIARTVGIEAARLAPGEEITRAVAGVAGGDDHLILSVPSGPELRLAERYAQITHRRLLLVTPSLAEAASGAASAHTVTFFPSLAEVDMAEALYELDRWLCAASGRAPRLGVLTAHDLVELTWLLAKQLLPREHEAATTLVSSEAAQATSRGALRVFGPARTVAEIVTGFTDARGTLLVSTHSRPHCGLLGAADGLVGMCGLASGGAGGRCEDGSACYFGEAPRAVMRDLQATRVFFNGCTTAGVGSRRVDHLPRASLIANATVGGAAREYVGNVRVGYYAEADVHWFAGASALGFSPAECVQIVEASRRAALREVLPSTLYIGDATNPSWPVEGVAIGEVTVTEGRAVVRWPRDARVRVARVPGAHWGTLAANDRLHAELASASPPGGVTIVTDPWEDASLILAAPPAEAEDTEDELLEITLTALDAPVDRSVGAHLEQAIEHARWLASLPAFSTLLAGAVSELEIELARLRAFSAARESVLLLPALLDHARALEPEIARRLDGRLIDEALTRSQASWDWAHEYTARARITPLDRAATCPSCGGFASASRGDDHVSARVARTILACGFCGISDLPTCGLVLRLAPETVTFTAEEIAGTAMITNEGERARGVTIGAVVQRAGEVHEGSRVKGELVVQPGTTASLDFALRPVKPMNEILQLRLYLASECAFGMVTQFVLFGRRAASAPSPLRLRPA